MEKTYIPVLRFSGNRLIIPSEVLFDKALTNNEKLILAFIMALSGGVTDYGVVCTATDEYLCELANVTKPTITKAISNFVKCGYIKKQKIYNGYQAVRIIHVN